MQVAVMGVARDRRPLIGFEEVEYEADVVDATANPAAVVLHDFVLARPVGHNARCERRACWRANWAIAGHAPVASVIRQRALAAAPSHN
jgi:hypothetical protein